MKKKNSARFLALIPLALILAACAWASVGDLVWLDQNGNGLQDPDEPGVEGVEVQIIQLFASEGRPAGSVAAGFACFPMNLQVVLEKSGPMLILAPCSDITDANGHYELGWPAEGVEHPYAIKFILPNGYEFTTPHVVDDSGSIGVRDSDVDPQFGVIPLPSWYIRIDRNGNCTAGWESLCADVSWISSYRILDAGLILMPTPTPEIVVALPPSIDPLDTPEVSVSVATNCRSGPSSNYSYVATVEIGQKVEVVAVFPGSEYVVVELLDGKQCWLWLRYADIIDFSAYPLPEATQPPTPTATNTVRPPTKTPGPADTATPTPTPTPKGPG